MYFLSQILPNFEKRKKETGQKSLKQVSRTASVLLGNDRPDSNPLPADDGTKLHLSVGKIVRVVEEDDRCKKKSTEVVTKQLGKFKV